MDLLTVFQTLAISLGLGLLVGLQRERARSRIAGIRTFALITVLGTVACLLDKELELGGWVVAAGLIGLAALLFVGNLGKHATEEIDLGLTTEVAALVMYGVGAYLVVGHTEVAVVLGGAVAIILYLKAPMHAFVARIGEDDFRAIMQFVLISLVILPVLPNEEYGPYQVLNPYKIWLMAVLIVGISLAGYVGYKLLGPGTGSLVGGILGGLISSTATTMSYARRAGAAQPAAGHQAAGIAALVIVIASMVAYARVIVEIAVVAPGVFWSLAAPLGVMLVWMIGIAAVMYRFVQNEPLDLPAQGNPAELVPALLFAGLYAVVVFALAAAKTHTQEYVGDAALYGVAILSGLHDMDAITLSTAGYVQEDQIPAATGWRLILAASLANFLMKGGIAAALGGRPLVRRLAAPFGAAFLGGGMLLALWRF
jgi:uncharacterized membrane protein (DUF4010 family)